MRLHLLVNGLVLAGTFLLCTGAMSAFSQDAPWEVFPWTLVGESKAGDRHYIAKESVVELPHAPDNRSYYRKVEFAEFKTIDGKPVDVEIADMFVDCESGMMDTLSVIRYFRGLRLEAIRIRSEDGKRIVPDTLTEQEFRFVCGNKLPRFLREKNAPEVRGAAPWR